MLYFELGTRSVDTCESCVMRKNLSFVWNRFWQDFCQFMSVVEIIKTTENFKISSKFKFFSFLSYFGSFLQINSIFCRVKNLKSTVLNGLQ